MKKNFLMVASLLIAAMLMVVSCTQEVAPKNDGLVEAKLGLAYGRDVAIAVDSVDNPNVITYTYSLSPKWNDLSNGTKIYGAVTKEPISGAYGVSSKVEDVSIGPLTPGLWEITVEGFAKGAKVLEGKTAAYFVNNNSTATVFVSPIKTEVKETVKIELKMEDLGDDNRNVINCSVSNLADVNATPSTVALSKTRNSDASYTYKAEVKLTAGYNTITFTTSETAGKGGITKTFLLIPGLSVTIKGSVYPAEFVTGTASIKVLDMSGATLVIKDSSDVDVTLNTTDNVFRLTNGANYSISVDDRALNLNDVTSGLPAGTISGEPIYTWYVNGKKVTGEEATKNITNGGKTLKFNKTAAGDYTVTCTIELDYTYHDAKGGNPNTTTTTYKAIGDASLGTIRVLPALASTPTPDPTPDPTTKPN